MRSTQIDAQLPDIFYRHTAYAIFSCITNYRTVNGTPEYFDPLKKYGISNNKSELNFMILLC